MIVDDCACVACILRKRNFNNMAAIAKDEAAINSTTKTTNFFAPSLA
jgi:hypothetical protein